MRSIPYEELRSLLGSFKYEALHLEMRDSYGTEVELPHFRGWLAGEPDDNEWLQSWFDTVRAGTQAGKSFRRARIVSEPLAQYQEWAFEKTRLFTEAGEDIRWVPRRQVSTVALPGNDFWLFDGELVVFLIFAGDGLVLDRLATTDDAAVELCASAFAAVWKLSIPNSEYRRI